MSAVSDPRPTDRRPPGELLFAAVFVGFALFLASQIGEQTIWARKSKLFAQPRFWPAVSIIGMIGFGLPALGAAWIGFRRRAAFERLPKERREAMIWLRAVEFVAWFMVYVFMVPVLGYLICTVAFVPLLAWRMGYRARLMLWAAGATGLGTVLVFKTFLNVKIPGGLIYEYLPGAARSFMIVYF